MLETLLYTLYLWVVFLVISATFLPLAKIFFKSGEVSWVTSKVLGLLILSYSAYLVGILHLFPFSQIELWILLLGWFLVNWRLRFRAFSLTSLPLRKIAVLETIFFLLVLLMALVRGYQPQIMGLEKYMDFGFIQSVLNSQYFPPQDMWWAGESINYYYFGHLYSGVLIKLLGVPAAIGYNLVLALIFGLAGTMIVTLLWSWTQRLWAGLLGAFLHLGIGNLHLVTNYFQQGGEWYLSSFNTYWKSYWYPDSSRLISHVITEFPVYSFVVYDLHAHVLAFPQDLLVIGLIAEFFRSKKFYLKEGVLIGFLLGVGFFTNAWDLAIYYLFLGLTLLLMVAFFMRSWRGVRDLGIGLATSLATSFLVILPFWIYFDSLSLPVLPTASHSPIWQLIQLWGLWFFLTISFGVWLWFRRKRELRDAFDWFILVMMGTGVLLIIIPEFVYVKDIYGGDYHRANTVFKLTFQSWNLFAIGGGYIVWRLVSHKASTSKTLIQGAWILVFLSLMISCALYTARAYKSGYGDFQNYTGIDGEAFFKTTYSEADYNAVKWIRENTPLGAVVLEAPGESYTEYSRISSFTGRPTVVGWTVHQWLWRGSIEPVTKRQADVQTIYTTFDANEFRDLVKKYNISYVYLSTLERVKYPEIGDSLTRLGRLVFNQENVQIYQVN